MRRILLMVSCLALGSPVLAGDFWVLGSYDRMGTAEQYGARISGEAGVEIHIQSAEVNGVPKYRLLTALVGNETDRDILRRQLESAGITDVWAITLDEAAERRLKTVFAGMETSENLLDDEFTDSEFDDWDDIDLAEIEALLAETDSVLPVLTTTEPDAGGATEDFVVAGSYLRASEASGLIARLEALGLVVSTREAMVEATTYHRVVIGPVLPAEHQAVISQLQSAGIEGAWPWRVRASYDESPSKPEFGSEPDPELSVSQSQLLPLRKFDEADDKYPDFNFSKLKERSGDWPMPDG